MLKLELATIPVNPSEERTKEFSNGFGRFAEE
jgi:hypothetical protein